MRKVQCTLTSIPAIRAILCDPRMFMDFGTWISDVGPEQGAVQMDSGTWILNVGPEQGAAQTDFGTWILNVGPKQGVLRDFGT